MVFQFFLAGKCILAVAKSGAGAYRFMKYLPLMIYLNAIHKFRPTFFMCNKAAR